MFFKRKKKEKRVLTLKEKIIENIKAIVIAGSIAIFIRTFLFQAFVIPSSSMYPTLLEGDYLIATKYDYGYSRYSLPFNANLINGKVFESEIKRGDIVVFRYPQDDLIYYVKRVIALPGDKFKIVNNTIYINNKPLAQEYNEDVVFRNNQMQSYTETNPEGKQYNIWHFANKYYQSNYKEITIPEDKYFLMGDNRHMSKDSRFPDVGLVDKTYIVGSPKFIFFSINGYFLQVWKWFTDIRISRMFKMVD